jgi:hypothetical protein
MKSVTGAVHRAQNSHSLALFEGIDVMDDSRK